MSFENVEYVIGIDQSYKRTGISLADKHGNILYATSYSPKASDKQFEKRLYLSNSIKYFMEKCSSEHHIEASNTIIIFERIRQFSQGFISMKYIVGTGALIATLSDYFCKNGYKCYWVDTRAWKSSVVGTSKPENNKYKIDPKKWPTIKYVKNFVNINKNIILVPEKRMKKGVIVIKGKFYSINDDLCDAICISQYFAKGKKELLKEEDF